MTAAAALVALAAAAPWLAVAPLGGPAAVIAHVLALVAAFHGAGWLLGRLATRAPVDPLLAIQWGIAALIGLSGLAIAMHLDGLATQSLIVYGFAAVHTGVLIARFAAYRTRLTAALATRQIWLVPAIALAAIAAFQIAGAAGQLDLRPFDDDGHVLAQLARLRETGALGDPIGYPRGTQLGGQLALGALATLGGDVHLVGLLEALAMALALALACSRLRGVEPARDATPGMWALLLAIAGAAFAYVPSDPAAVWTAVGLVLSLHAMLARAEVPAIPLGMTAGALIALRFELAPIAVVALAAAWWSERTRRHALILVASTLAVVAPYVLARALAWHSVGGAAHTLLAPARGSLPVRLALYAGVLAACAPLAVLTWRHRGLRWLGVAAAFTIAGIASQLTGDRPYATHLLWPLAIAGALIVVTELARDWRVGVGALLASLLVVALIHDGREASGRRRWVRRYLDAAANIEYLRHAGPTSSGYDALLREVPAGATVAVWVARPERLDYAGHVRILDLRTPRGARLRTHRWDDHKSRFEALLAATGAGYLLLETDDKLVERRQRDAIERFACGWSLPGCADDLEVVAEAHRVIAERSGVRLIELAP